MKIGAQIKKYRATKGLSQLDLALSIGYKNQADVSRIERDEQWPDADRLDAIAKALDCNVSDFFIHAEYENGIENESISRLGGHLDRISSSLEDGVQPSLENAYEAVRLELPSIDDRTQAQLAVQLFTAQIAKQNADRLVSVLSSIALAIERSSEND